MELSLTIASLGLPVIFTDIHDVYPKQKKYNSLTTENMMSLLGLENEYNVLKNANGELILSADYGANMQVYCSVYSTSGSMLLATQNPKNAKMRNNSELA